jgi:hypothetical protein
MLFSTSLVSQRIFGSSTRALFFAFLNRSLGSELLKADLDQTADGF